MTRPLVAVPSYPRLPRGRVHGWADDGVGVPARYVDALHRAQAQEALFLPTAWTAADAAALPCKLSGTVKDVTYRGTVLDYVVLLPDGQQLTATSTRRLEVRPGAVVEIGFDPKMIVPLAD